MERSGIGAQTGTRLASPSEDELVTALWARGIRVFPKTGVGSPLSDGELIRGLLTSVEARFQLAVIPLLLGQPTCDAAVKAILDTLSIPQRATFTFYYQAATYLQILEQEQLPGNHPLHDYFSEELALPVAAHLKDQRAQLEEALRATARLQATSTGLDLNWMGAYMKAAEFVLGKTGNGSSQHRAQRPL